MIEALIALLIFILAAVGGFGFLAYCKTRDLEILAVSIAGYVAAWVVAVVAA